MTASGVVGFSGDIFSAKVGASKCDIKSMSVFRNIAQNLYGASTSNDKARMFPSLVYSPFLPRSDNIRSLLFTAGPRRFSYLALSHRTVDPFQQPLSIRNNQPQPAFHPKSKMRASIILSAASILVSVMAAPITKPTVRLGMFSR
jgi:hypothetical protein